MEHFVWSSQHEGSDAIATPSGNPPPPISSMHTVFFFPDPIDKQKHIQCIACASNTPPVSGGRGIVRGSHGVTVPGTGGGPFLGAIVGSLRDLPSLSVWFCKKGGPPATPGTSQTPRTGRTARSGVSCPRPSSRRRRAATLVPLPLLFPPPPPADAPARGLGLFTKMYPGNVRVEFEIIVVRWSVLYTQKLFRQLMPKNHFPAAQQNFFRSRVKFDVCSSHINTFICF